MECEYFNAITVYHHTKPNLLIIYYYFRISSSVTQLRMVLDSLKTENEFQYVPSLELCRQVSVLVAAENTAIRKTCHLRIVFQLIQDSLNINSTV